MSYLRSVLLVVNVQMYDTKVSISIIVIRNVI